MVQICVDTTGKVYAAQHSGIGCIIKVLGSKGQLLRTIGGTRAGVSYPGVAVNSRGQVFVSRFETGTNKYGVIEVYDAGGNLLHSFSVAGFRPGAGFIFMDRQDLLCIPCPYTSDIKVLSTDGTVVRRIDLHGKVMPYSIAVSDKGRLWVGGRLPQPDA